MPLFSEAAASPSRSPNRWSRNLSLPEWGVRRKPRVRRASASHPGSDGSDEIRKTGAGQMRPRVKVRERPRLLVPIRAGEGKSFRHISTPFPSGVIYRPNASSTSVPLHAIGVRIASATVLSNPGLRCHFVAALPQGYHLAAPSVLWRLQNDSGSLDWAIRLQSDPALVLDLGTNGAEANRIVIYGPPVEEILKHLRVQDGNLSPGFGFHPPAGKNQNGDDRNVCSIFSTEKLRKPMGISKSLFNAQGIRLKRTWEIQSLAIINNLVSLFVFSSFLRLSTHLGFDSKNACGRDNDVIDVPGFFAVFLHFEVVKNLKVSGR